MTQNLEVTQHIHCRTTEKVRSIVMNGNRKLQPLTVVWCQQLHKQVSVTDHNAP